MCVKSWARTKITSSSTVADIPVQKSVSQYDFLYERHATNLSHYPTKYYSSFTGK